MKLLTITSLFPNAADPKHGVFVETRLRQLQAEYPEVELTVIAPVPWFPLRSRRFGRYAKYAAVPAEETRIGARVLHPRYLVIPKIGMLLTPLFMALSLLRCIRRLRRAGTQFDLVDGHYLYPDGVAIALCAPMLGKPFVLTARGTDLNLIPRFHLPRRWIQRACAKAHAVITVCEALRQAAIEIGVPADKVITLRNGVDLSLFAPPRDRDQLRAELNLVGKCILSVGHLIERKGHHLIIDALPRLEGAQLYIVGDGPEGDRLQARAAQRGVADRVHFVGSRSQPELARYYGAADLLVLASSREGWANVLLEAMACGTPVVATHVWGTPEVVQRDDVGQLCHRDSQSLADAIDNLLREPRDRVTVRAYAEQFDWQATSEGQFRLFRQLVADAGERPGSQPRFDQLR